MSQSLLQVKNLFYKIVAGNFIPPLIRSKIENNDDHSCPFCSLPNCTSYNLFFSCMVATHLHGLTSWAIFASPSTKFSSSIPYLDITPQTYYLAYPEKFSRFSKQTFRAISTVLAVNLYTIKCLTFNPGITRLRRIFYQFIQRQHVQAARISRELDITVYPSFVISGDLASIPLQPMVFERSPLLKIIPWTRDYIQRRNAEVSKIDDSISALFPEPVLPVSDPIPPQWSHSLKAFRARMVGSRLDYDMITSYFTYKSQ